MRIDFDGDDSVLNATHITVKEDRDGFFTASMALDGCTVGGVSRDRFVAVAYCLEKAAETLKARKGEPAQRNFPSRDYSTGYAHAPAPHRDSGALEDLLKALKAPRD